MNRLHVYTGDGKGKTTAAMGLALWRQTPGRAVISVVHDLSLAGDSAPTRC